MSPGSRLPAPSWWRSPSTPCCPAGSSSVLRYVVPALELVLFVPLVAANPRHMSRHSVQLRRLAIALVLLIAVANGGC